MSNPTTPFNWQMPQNTDLVTDLPADFEVFGQAVATSMQDLLGGTTGQVLAKASNTDMDFVWSADAAGMTNPMTTTGDIIYSSSGSTPARKAIGSTGQVLTVAGGIPSWASAASGLTLIDEFTVTAQNFVQFVGVFSATYKNYMIVFTGASSTGSTSLLDLRLISNTTEITSGYSSQRLDAESTTVSAAAHVVTDVWRIGVLNTSSTKSNILTMTIANPFVATETGIQSFISTTAQMRLFGGMQSNATSYDGFEFLSGATITGTWSVYGMSKE